MVESIGSKPVKADLGVVRVAAATPAPKIRTSAPSAPSDVAQTGSLVQSLSAGPPVDLDQVARVKQAIADGNYPIVPGTIADNMLAMRLKMTQEGSN